MKTKQGRQFGIGAEHLITDVIEVLIWNPIFSKFYFRLFKWARRLREYSKELKAPEIFSLRIMEFWGTK